MGIHHITHIDNLTGIIETGLKSRNSLKETEYVDTADEKIIEKRDGLNSYVPFHIDMLQRNHGIDYNHVVIKKYGKENMIFLIKKIYRTTDKSIYCLYHPTSRYCKNHYKSYPAFNKDFKIEYKDLPQNQYGPDYSNNRVQKFFASEILIRDHVEIDDISTIYVYDDEAGERVVDKLDSNDIRHIEVLVNPLFYR